MKFTYRDYSLNRKDRREQAREQRRIAFECKRYEDMNPVERKQAELYEQSLKSVERNGITRADLSREYDRGFTNGLKTQQEIMQRKDYAALAMAVKRALKLGPTRTVRVMKEFDRALIELIPNDALVDEYLNECGVTLNLQAVFDDERVEES